MGFATIMILVSMLGGLQLMALGLLGEILPVSMMRSRGGQST